MIILPETKVTTRLRRRLAIAQNEDGYVVVEQHGEQWTPIQYPTKTHPLFKQARADLQLRVDNDSDLKELG
jgi:hypothetical protein